nr:biopolymer transporter ExbD [Acinetobacter sp. Marseille-Q1620]
MEMNATNSKQQDEDDLMLEVNMTPLIDVMLVLIIMFIITIPIPNNAIHIQLPSAAPPVTSEKPPETINLMINAQGKIFWNEKELHDIQALEVLFKNTLKKREQDLIKIKPDQQVEYKNVATVMALAQRLGIKKISIVSSQ